MKLPTPYTLTRDCYIRLWAGEILPDRSRVLYLDPDTIVTKSLETLWRTDLRGRTIGAVPIPNSDRPIKHGMPFGSLFFNSGVLLIDLNRWRALDYCGKCLEMLRHHPEWAIDADQDILNLCLIEDWLALDYTWNAISPFFRPSYDLGLSCSEIARVTAEARIVHFNGIHKPWMYMDNHPRQRDYFHYLRQTDWRDYRPADKTTLNVLRKHLALVAPAWLRSTMKQAVNAVDAIMAGRVRASSPSTVDTKTRSR